MNIEARPRSARTFTLRLLGLLLALVLAGGLASASQMRAAKASDGLELTFTKWITAYPNMGGVVGGDIEGRFAGYIDGLRLHDSVQRALAVSAPRPRVKAVWGRRAISTPLPPRFR